MRRCPASPWLPQKVMLDNVDALLADAPRRSVLLCDSSKLGEDGGWVARRCRAAWVAIRGCGSHWHRLAPCMCISGVGML